MINGRFRELVWAVPVLDAGDSAPKDAKTAGAPAGSTGADGKAAAK